MQKKRMVLVVPPDGSPMRSFMVPRIVIGAIAAIALVGVAGFFVPLDYFTISKDEQHRRKILSAENSWLEKRVDSFSRIVNSLHSQLKRLDKKRFDLIAANAPRRAAPPAARLRMQSFVRLDQMYRYIAVNERLFVEFARQVQTRRTLLSSIPLAKPLLEPAVISERFGKRTDPFTGTTKGHYGVDLVAPEGAPVIATASGVVVSAERSRTWGNRIRIQHSKGFSSVYAHLEKIAIWNGKHVVKGEVIGTVGATGMTIGPHLHYSILKQETPVNPEDYFFPQEVQPRLPRSRVMDLPQS